MDDIGRAVKRIEEGEAWEETDEEVEIEVKRPLDKVVPVRLPSDKWEELRREARELGVGPITLARMWILEKLRQVLLVPQHVEFAGHRRAILSSPGGGQGRALEEISR